MVGCALTAEDVDAIRRAARREDVRRAMGAFYAELDAAIAAHQPVCRRRGACCRFDEYGHNLFVTTLEAAYFVAFATPPPSRTPARASARSAPRPGCPCQTEGRCGVRDVRPMGCRVFFCDPQSQHWQGPLTEDSLRVLRALHERLAVPYRYVEWRNLLASLGL